MAMNKLFISVLCCCLGCAIGLNAQDSGYFTVNGKAVSIAGLNKEIISIMDDLEIPGMSFAVIDNNQVVFSNFYGYKKTSPQKKVNKRTVFEACSLSKQFLVFVALKLVDEGKLDLDKPLYQYLPYEPLEYDARYKLITSRMVLSHTSGLENWKRDNDKNKLEILKDPGTAFVYSGAGYNYLGEVIEKILGTSENKYFKNIVFRPLKLHRTFSAFHSFRLFPSNYATGYTVDGKKVKKWKNVKPVPSSAINTIASDYAKLIIATFNKTQLSDDRVKDILQPLILLDTEPGKSVYWGGGCVLEFSPADTVVMQNGSNTGFKGWMHYSVVNKSGLVYFTNGDYGISIAQKLNELTAHTDVGLNSIGLQYPNVFFILLKLYRTASPSKLFDQIDSINSRAAIPYEIMNRLGWDIFKRDKETGKKIMEKSVRLYNDKPDAWYNLAKVNMQLHEYAAAYENLMKCKELNYHADNLNEMIDQCKLKIGGS